MLFWAATGGILLVREGLSGRDTAQPETRPADFLPRTDAPPGGDHFGTIVVSFFAAPGGAFRYLPADSTI